MVEKQTKMQLKYTLRNTNNGQTQSFIIADDHKSQKELEKLVAQSIRLLCQGGTPVSLVKMRFQEVSAVKVRTKKGHEDQKKKKETIKNNQLLRISVANAARFTSQKVASELTEYLDEAPNDQGRIDEVLFMLRFVLIVRRGKSLQLRKDLQQADFQELLARIYQQEVWSEAMIAAYWEIRLLFSKRKCERQALKNKFHQEVARVNASKGQAYFTKQGQFVDEPRTDDGTSLMEMIKKFIYGAFHQEELGGYYEISLV